MKLKSNNWFLVRGYACVFNNADSYNDIILRDALRDIDISRMPVLWQHNTEQPIGKVVDVHSDDVGLLCDIHICMSLQLGKDIFSLVSEDIVTGLSIGYESIKAHKRDSYRLIERLEVWEISLVTFPANPRARIIEINNLEDVSSSEQLLDISKEEFSDFNSTLGKATSMLRSGQG